MGVGIEHLMLRLDHLDQRRNALLDLAKPNLNPFRQCRVFLARVVAEGFRPGAVLYPVYVHFHDTPLRGDLLVGPQNDNLMLDCARTMGLDMGSQAFWRFLPFTTVPFTLTDCVNPALSRDKQMERMQTTFGMNPCCVDPGCTLKLVNKYQDPVVALANPRLLSGIRTLGYCFTFANMISERQLASLRQALGGMAGEEMEAIWPDPLNSQTGCAPTRFETF